MAATLERLRAGDPAAAVAILEDAAPSDPAERGFLGMLLCRVGRTADGATVLASVLATRPGDLTTRVNLATALLSLHRADEATDVIAGAPVRDVRLRRLHAFICQERGALDEACAAYEEVVRAVPTDFEALNNLGNARLELGDADAAIVALRGAVGLRPDIAMPHVNLARALTTAERHAERLTAMRAAARRFPGDAAILLELGLAEGANDNFDNAERALRRSIAREPADPAAYLELAILYENLNRLDALDTLVDEAAAGGVPSGEVGFIRGWALRRRGRFADALAAADALPDTISAMRRHQLAAELADRLDLPARAFTEFEAMNREAGRLHPRTKGETDFVTEVRATAARLTALEPGGWRAVPAGATMAPVIIAGFPRSGTTLLDTLLMNLPQVHVLEERPVLDPVRAALGDPARLATLGTAETDRLRRLYAETLYRIEPKARAARTLIDKNPFHMVRIDVLHRLFPDAKIVLVERHPCDAVLSCFMQNFRLHRSTRPLATLGGAAELYDAAFGCWETASLRLPLDVHRIRYEHMIDDLEREMRALTAFLGLPFAPSLLDNQGAAARRGRIATASYAQVGQPIYARAIGRWERYRTQMADVMPVLAPWAERMGYAV